MTLQKPADRGPVRTAAAPRSLRRCVRPLPVCLAFGAGALVGAGSRSHGRAAAGAGRGALLGPAWRASDRALPGRSRPRRWPSAPPRPARSGPPTTGRAARASWRRGTRTRRRCASRAGRRPTGSSAAAAPRSCSTWRRSRPTGSERGRAAARAWTSAGRRASRDPRGTARRAMGAAAAAARVRDARRPRRGGGIAAEGLHALGYCKSAQLLELGADPAGSGLRRGGGARAARARQALVAHVLPGPEQALVRAMVLGDRGRGRRHRGRLPRGGHLSRAGDLGRAGGAPGVAPVVGAGARGLPAACPAPWCCRSPSSFYAELVGGDVPVARAPRWRSSSSPAAPSTSRATW